MSTLRLPQRTPATRPQRRPARSFATRCEPLEGRVVLATTVLDPTFGAGGVVLGATSRYDDTNLAEATAIAVQPDGKIVVVGEVGARSRFSGVGVAARRYNPDGSLDTSFGTGGRTDILYDDDRSAFEYAPKNVAIAPDGSIVFAAATRSVRLPGPPGVATAMRSVIVRLTPTGQLDPTFGANHGYVVGEGDGLPRDVAVQADGKVVVAYIGTASNQAASVTVSRLTATGVPDATFNGTGAAEAPLPATDVLSDVVALTLTPTGQILVGATQTRYVDRNVFATSYLAEFGADGAPDASFGSGGLAAVTANRFGVLTALAVQSDGAIVVAGVALSTLDDYDTRGTTLARLTPAGAVDPSFDRFGPIDPVGEYVTAVALGANGAITVGGSRSVDETLHPFVARYLSTGAIDAGFGRDGRALLAFEPAFAAGNLNAPQFTINDIAPTTDGRILAAGMIANVYRDPTTGVTTRTDDYQAFLARVLPIRTAAAAVANDYDGDGRADVAGVLGAFGLFAYRPSAGTPDVLAPFGPSTVGAAIPAPGDYDGDGRADIAAYFPAAALLVSRPAAGGADVVVPFGIPGPGRSIPAPGDYDGDGRTDPAVYLADLGILAYRPSSGGGDVLVPFGTPGAGRSIPAPGDYDGDGRTDVAVYLTDPGVLAYRPSSGGADVLAQFGSAGSGLSIPAPGDYDGDGRADPAVFLPTIGVLAYRPSAGGADVLQQFGIPGAGQSVPMPGDYDGDGRTDVAVFLPAIAYAAYRPSAGGADVLEQFGAAGPGQTVPAASLPAAVAEASLGTVSSSSAGVVGGSTAVYDLALTDDLTSAELAQARRRKKSAT